MSIAKAVSCTRKETHIEYIQYFKHMIVKVKQLFNFLQATLITQKCFFFIM